MAAVNRTKSVRLQHEESSESEIELETARALQNAIFPSRNNTPYGQVAMEGYLMKQTSSFQRWKRRYFRLRGDKLAYSKGPDSEILDEFDLSNLCCSETKIRNINHTFQITTPTRTLILAADHRKAMEDWSQALKSTSLNREYYDTTSEQYDFLSGVHHWVSTTHARPTYCNICRDTLSGVTSHGLSCEICNFKVHKRCVSKTINNCKWTTLASVGKDIIEDVDGNLIMPHQWMEGNISPVSSKCIDCDKTCGSVMRLQDWRCLWCRATVHTQCRHLVNVRCPLGPNRVSIVQPISLHSIGTDEAWDFVKPLGSFSPLLVFVNSKSGDNQGIKFLRRFKQQLNPAQVFDLVQTGPGFGLRLFRHFELFRILICSGDGTVGWVLSEIDRLNMHKQCQIAVLPLGTGNDLARVLGWGASADDDTNIVQLLDKYETASTKMLDRWSIMIFERDISFRRGMSISQSPDAILWYLQSIVENDDFHVVLASTSTLSETVNEFISRIMESNHDDDNLVLKCNALKEKVDFLLNFLKGDEVSKEDVTSTSNQTTAATTDEGASVRDKRDRSVESERKRRFSFGKTEKDKINTKERTSRQLKRSEREAVHCRVGSLKRIINDIIDECDSKTTKAEEKVKSNVRFVPTSSSENSPCASPSFTAPATTANTTSYLSCISPLPDMRRESFDEVLMSSLKIPAPRQFADESRRNSRVQEGICEADEDNYVESCQQHGNSLTVPRVADGSHFRFDSATINQLSEKGESNDEQQGHDNLMAFRPIEVMERNELRISQQKKLDEVPQKLLAESKVTCRPESFSTNLLQVPVINIPYLMEKPPTRNNDTTGYTLLAESPQQDRSSSDEIFGETSDIVSAISRDEECSVSSEILDQKVSEPFAGDINVGNIIRDLNDDEKLGHIDSPESETTDALHGESLINDDMNSVLGLTLQDMTSNDDTTTICKSDTSKITQHDDEKDQFGFENKVFELSDIATQLPSAVEPVVKYCSLARFDGNDIARKSFRKPSNASSASPRVSKWDKDSLCVTENAKMHDIDDEIRSKEDEEMAEKVQKQQQQPVSMIKIQIHGSTTDLSMETEFEIPRNVKFQHIDYHTADLTDTNNDALAAEIASPKISEQLRLLRASEYRRHSSHVPQSTLAPKEVDVVRRHSNHNPNLITYETERAKFLNCSPAASRRISCGTLLRNTDRISFSSTKNLFQLGRKSISKERDKLKDDDEKRKDEKNLKPKTLPIINPLVRLPSWPNIANSQIGSGFISKCLLANADTLCSMACPLMNPDEPQYEEFFERSVMNNYFGIGIDAKITLDFHNKREEHPEKCRSRAKNYMWYGVLGSKQWLQKTYRNLEQRVQLECDGQRIPLPFAIQGIVILNIPSFMGGANFWGSSKEDDIFLAPSFDDRILEVVAVFGSVQMAACRLINLQHHRIAQCQSIQINILGDEGVPVQVDGEAWIQPPGMMRIMHKNRVQMLCRNRGLEVSLKSWQEKQRQHSISIAREQTSLTSEYSTALGDSLFTERETYLLFNFIENVSTLVKWVKFLIVSHPSLQQDLYTIACKTADSLEAIHPGGKLVDGPTLRTKLTELVASTRGLYESTCELLRERGQTIVMREDLETKLSVALANIEMELRKCSLQKSEDGSMKIYLNILAPNNNDTDQRKKSKPFWDRFRHREHQSQRARTARSTSREAVSNWGVNEVITWLEAMQLSEYIDTFIKNDIRGKELLTLARRDLKELGVTKVGHVKRILQAIKDLQTS